MGIASAWWIAKGFFFRGNTTVMGGHCLVQWKIVCRSKNEGGLGIKDLETMIIALMAKWWWRFFIERNHRWGVFLNALYYHRRKPLLEGRSFKPYSFWWRCVITTREIVKCGISFSIGDGKRVDFWNDIWCDHLSLHSSHSGIFDRVSSKNLRVQDCWNGSG